MKRLLLTFFLSVPLMLFSLSPASASVLAQESDSTDILDAFSAFTSLIGTGIGAAVDQVMNGYGPETAGPTELPAPAEIPTATQLPTATPIPTSTNTPVPTATALPTSTNTPVPTATNTSVPTATEAPFRDAPGDPESRAASFGIEVSDFYNAFKAAVKAGGRHQVSFEEKGRKNASRVSVDDGIEVYLYYSKTGGTNLLERISFEAEAGTGKEETLVRTILWDLFAALSDYVNVPLTDADFAVLYPILRQNGSAVCGDLLLYGTMAEKGGKDQLTVKVYYTGSGYVETPVSTYDQNAEADFRDLIDDLKASGTIPNRDGVFHFHEDYETEWAQINWYQWETFTDAQNFVISADLTWKSASQTPNYQYSGCGFVFRALDSNNNLYAAVNMDGRLHFGGYRSGRQLNYGDQKYGSVSTKGSAQMVLVVNGDTASVYVDGVRVGQQRNLAIDESGGLAFTVWSGTNKDYGTRCTFEHVYYYVF